MKIDPYKHQEKYLNWQEKTKDGIIGIGEYNSNLLKRYLSDMEKGLNVAACSEKGPRGFGRLNTIKDRFIIFAKDFKKYYNLDRITGISEDQLIELFTNMKNGVIKTKYGKAFRTQTLVKVFKAFWHWWMKANKKEGIEIKDITVDMDTSQEKPEWVYLTEKEVKMLCDNAKYDYKVLIMFLFDTGIRAPTELMNIRVSDFFNNFKELNIREEISKTFGRRIKLMICSQLIEDYIKAKNLGPEDYLFKIVPSKTNQYLKRLAIKTLGNRESPAGAKYADLTMYDFRHCACCYWLPRYKSESALKYRFGWKKSDKIHYYSELLGMRDTIVEEDLLIDVTKTEIEQRLEKSEKEKEIMQDRLISMEKYMQRIMKIADKLQLEVES